MRILITAALLSITLLPTMPASAQTDPVANEATPARPTLIIIGASYAAGWGTPALPGFKAVINKGVGGQETSAVRQRFAADVVSAKPDSVLIWGHINDIHRAPAGGMEQVKKRAQSNYTEMVAEARNAGINVLLATEITLTIGDTWKEKLLALIARIRGKQDYRDMVNSHVKELNQWLRELAQSEKLMLVDFERAVDSGNGTRRVEYSSADGSHVSEAGYAALTRYATTVLAQSSQRGRTSQ